MPNEAVRIPLAKLAAKFEQEQLPPEYAVKLLSVCGELAALFLRHPNLQPEMQTLITAMYDDGFILDAETFKSTAMNLCNPTLN